MTVPSVSLGDKAIYRMAGSQSMRDATPSIVPEPRIGAALRHGWHALWDRFWILLGVTLLYGLAQIPSNAYQIPLGPGDSFGLVEGLAAGAIGLYSLLVVVPLGIGFYYAFLHAVRGEPVELRDLGQGFRTYTTSVMATLLMALAVMVGLVLLIIPGIIVAIRLLFVPFVVCERPDLGPVEVLKESWRLTEGHGWPLFGLILLCIPILLLGLLLLIVGVIPAAMWITAAMASYYHGVTGEPSPASPSPGTAISPA